MPGAAVAGGSTMLMSQGRRTVRAMETILNPSHPAVPELRGRGLRFVLVDELMRRREATVAELVAALADQGHVLAGRASKVISDALRWEVRRGRVTRRRRGCYRYERAPRTTARRIRLFAARCRTWLVAVMRGQEPPPTPPDPRAYPLWVMARPEDPPWRYLGWLWVT